MFDSRECTTPGAKIRQLLSFSFNQVENTTVLTFFPSKDGYYGHEATAKMGAAFITSLFACPELPPPSTNLTSSGQPVPSPKLALFVAYALHRTRLASCVTFAALFLLQRLKNRFPAARGSSGHRLFISAFMIASKVVCDDTYSNKSWAVVGQGMFQLKEINQMEREMCGYLEWHLNIDYQELEQFTEKTQLEFGSGVVNPLLPVTSSIAPAQPKTAAVSLSNPTAPRLTPSYGTAAGTPATLLTSAGDEDEELESPSNSLTSSPASSALQTPPSNADIDGPDSAKVVVPGAQTNGGIIGTTSGNAPASTIPKVMQTGGVGAMDPAKIKVTLDRHGRPAFASAARW
jgi:hypothetical protein